MTTDANWLGFVYSWLLDSLTFNASQIGNWLPTQIQPNTWWSDWLVWLFCVVSDVILLGILLNILRLVRVVVTARVGIDQQS